jgi:hypothetical protein
VRFPDFLKVAVLLFAGSATCLAVVAIAGASAQDETEILYVAVGWWLVATLIGLWLGRRSSVASGVADLMANARSTTALPEFEPGVVVFNRLWALGLFTILAGAVAFLIPQVPAIAAGYALILALLWRKQARAVIAVEQRDGVQFYVDRSSPFRPTRLVRLPGFRKVEPSDLETVV